MITVEDIRQDLELNPEYSERGYEVYCRIDDSKLKLADILGASIEEHAAEQYDNRKWKTDEEKAQGREVLSLIIAGQYIEDWDADREVVLDARLVGMRWPPKEREKYNVLFRENTYPRREMSYTHWRRIKEDKDLAMWVATTGASTAALDLEIKKRKGEIDGFEEAKRLALKHVKEMVKKSHNLEQREQSILAKTVIEEIV